MFQILINREEKFFLQNLENREEKENENSIFSSERERERSVFLEISRDSRLLLMPVKHTLRIKNDDLGFHDYECHYFDIIIFNG